MGTRHWLCTDGQSTGGKALLITLAVVALFVSVANSAAVMSVDLGSEWMKVGVVSPGVPMEIALNKESKRKTPTTIAFRNGDRVFGEDAQTLGVRFPSNSFGYLVDLLGKTIDNPMVDLYRKRFPYYDIVEDPVRKTVVFRVGEDQYTIEELIAQLLQVAKSYAEDSTGQLITECVLIVPGFFGQAERTALVSAARLANLKVLQLINDYTAVALNYGIFRRKEINETAQYFLFYDMGAYKTSAAVVSYQLVKDKATRETHPVVQVLGVGFDRTLGGLEMQVRLRDYLGKEFNKMGKTKTDVFSNPRAMAKLFKEAGRLKNVLSANTEHYAQIEGLLDEQDFRLLVTREQFEGLNKDLYERVTAPLDKALAASGLALDVINQVVLFGGNTRVPKMQDILSSHIGQPLAKNLNADEAACMGAVYRAADLATGFKVKKFITKDAVLFPIQVVFDREGESGAMRQVRRTLFGAMNSYPQKKVITFNKHTDDFEFTVQYAELESLLKDEAGTLGSIELARVKLSEVAKKLKSSVAENVESKGIKAHFMLDDSGIFSLANVELVLEKTVTKEDDEDESTFQKIGNTISKLFSGDSTDKSEKVTEGAEKTEEDESADGGKDAKDGEKEPEAGDKQSTKDKEADAAKDTKADGKEGAAGAGEAGKKPEEGGAEAKNATAKPKIVTLKEPIPSKVELTYVAPLDGDLFEASAKRLSALDELDKAKKRRETALNALESFVIDAQVKMDEQEYASCATEEEIATIRARCSEISEWLYEDGTDADAETYETKLEDLRAVANEVYARHWEHEERPQALNALKQMINGSEGFLRNARNLTKDSNPEKDVFTAVEIETLEKAIRNTIEWRDTEVAEQEKLARNEPVRLTVKDITDRMGMLDREVKYLVNKLKLWRPKIKPTPPPKPEKTTGKEGEKEEAAATGEEKPVEEPVLEQTPEKDGTTETEPEEPTVEEIDPTATRKDGEEGGDHTEL
ncbi:hypoxia up-regulated protein 1 [Anopheles stephensi]|uniref:hypoxia up-regulated protein 1 n=1 Tax=Anopheles stephensi TaxID=30069 RepID=UPI0016589604|nr:hypoxia up-regulated protein 1 [Anopheles stephensi]XP_035900001.1 hypoxia up-regulated protein 1 [Anopheles stephensi]